ncbi:MAG: hypothetical protein GYA55_12690 [SAR324 cluster bacterium]|uniref:SbsA Ig-like domain-containing protein n=1 Tax=SAR324 cluster bacterium TaxID=2024889 RepID=A0A7X9FTH1_9DELT|nr:hypothetical protein [SAR324 cluster bacterium]
MRFALLLIISLGLFVSLTSAQEISKSLPAQDLLRISPSGEDVPLAREIVLQFSQPAVPIGRMERSAEEVPLDFAPPINCNWRWLNTTSLSCQLNEADKLKVATKYLIRIKDDPKGDEAKQLIAPLKKYLGSKDPEGRSRSVFVTEVPKLTSYSFKTWKAPGLPSIYIYFNFVVSRSSVLKHVFFLSPFGKRVPIVIEEKGSRESDKDSSKDSSVYLISPSKELPLDASIRLHVEPGLISPQGPKGRQS